MKSGLLWYDNSKSTLSDKIERAAKRYKEKFGIAPTIAFVHPKELELDTKLKGIIVKPKSTIMPNHIWLGVL